MLLPLFGTTNPGCGMGGVGGGVGREACCGVGREACCMEGCGEELVKTISRMSPSRVVYVSCDPATLARDLKFFTENGYTPKEITPCDMFSGTSHVESVALIERN